MIYQSRLVWPKILYNGEKQESIWSESIHLRKGFSYGFTEEWFTSSVVVRLLAQLTLPHPRYLLNISYTRHFGAYLLSLKAQVNFYELNYSGQ